MAWHFWSIYNHHAPRVLSIMPDHQVGDQWNQPRKNEMTLFIQKLICNQAEAFEFHLRFDRNFGYITVKSVTGIDNFCKWSGTFRSDRTDRSKRTNSRVPIEHKRTFPLTSARNLVKTYLKYLRIGRPTLVTISVSLVVLTVADHVMFQSALFRHQNGIFSIANFTRDSNSQLAVDSFLSFSAEGPSRGWIT